MHLDTVVVVELHRLFPSAHLAISRFIRVVQTTIVVLTTIIQFADCMEKRTAHTVFAAGPEAEEQNTGKLWFDISGVSEILLTYSQ